MISKIEGWAAQVTGLGEAMTPDSLACWQVARVREAITYVRRRSSLYAERLGAVAEEGIRSLSDLETLPFTYPEDILRDPESLLCVPLREISRVTTICSSGTTAEPKRIYFTAGDLRRTADFFALGMSTLTEAGQRTVIFLSTPTPDSIADLLRKGLDEIEVTPRVYGHLGDLERARSEAFGADCLVGVPGEMICLCRTYPELRPKRVLLSADYVPESVIRGLEEGWRCQVFTHYGMTETGFACAVQCDAGEGHHLRHGELLVEVVDPVTGRQAAPGEAGEVVITTFAHEAMPLIRYRTGDRASMILSPCPCGGLLPRLGRVQGRLSGLIALGQGRTLTVQGLDELLYSLPQVRNYRAELDRKRSPSRLRLTLDVLGSIEEGPLRRLLRDSLGDRLRIELLFRELPLSGDGKKRSLHLMA